MKEILEVLGCIILIVLLDGADVNPKNLVIIGCFLGVLIWIMKK